MKNPQSKSFCFFWRAQNKSFWWFGKVQIKTFFFQKWGKSKLFKKFKPEKFRFGPLWRLYTGTFADWRLGGQWPPKVTGTANSRLPTSWEATLRNQERNASVIHCKWSINRRTKLTGTQWQINVRTGWTGVASCYLLTAHAHGIGNAFSLQVLACPQLLWHMDPPPSHARTAMVLASRCRKLKKRDRQNCTQQSKSSSRTKRREGGKGTAIVNQLFATNRGEI